MIIITPIETTAATLIDSNVPETDAPAWTAGTYTIGQQRIYNHRVYEVLVASTTDQPDLGAAASPPTWLDTGATNRFKMFDQIISTDTAQTGTIEVTIEPGTVANGVAMFGLSGTSVTVTMNVPGEGEVYSRTDSLQDNTLILDWYGYFFEDVTYKSDAVFIDLPSYGTASLSITIDAGVSTARCGELVIGKQRSLGLTNFGTSVSIQDYSVKSTDQFGNVVVVQRAYSKRADYDVTVETSKVASAQSILAGIRTTPTVFIGDESRAETVVYGFYRQWNIVLSTPTISDCSIEVEGLV